MKHKFGRIVASIASIFGITGALLIAPAVYAAGTATLSLSPASGTYNKGQTISVTVYENSGGDNVNAVQANLSYNTGQLKYVSFSNASAFEIEAENPSGNTGTINFARGTITPKSGTQAVVTVRFSVIASSGTASISFASGSAVVRSTDNQIETLTKSGGSYKIATPVTPPPPPPPSPSPSPSPTPTPPPTFIPPPTSTTKPSTSTTNHSSGSKLTITSVQSSNNGPSNSTVITWQTNRPATSSVFFGSDKDHLVPANDGSLVTIHRVVLPQSELKSGNTYYFYVSSTDNYGSTTSSQLLPFIASGDTVANENNLKLNKQVFTIVGIGAVILAAILVLFAVYRLQQSLKEQRELKSHFPDLNNGNQQSGQGVVTFQAGGPPPGSSQSPNPNVTPNQGNDKGYR